MKAPSTILPPYETNWPPNYTEVFQWRQYKVLQYHQNPALLYAAKCFYKDHPVEFINHWCTTYDPRNADSDKLVFMPLVLFGRQEDFVRFIYECLRDNESGLAEKCRDYGATWVCCAISVHLWLFVPGADIGWGSKDRDLVDKLGDISSIFEKMRVLIRYLPRMFLPKGFSLSEHMPFMRIVNPETKASIIGEVGDNIGRGGRRRLVFKDESAHYLHPELIEAALLSTTNCQMDVSSVHGMGTVFHRKREAGIDWTPGIQIPKGKTRVIVLDWRDHPEKTQEWYEREKQNKKEQGLEHIFNQEVERDYAGSVEGVIINAAWVRASLDAHKKLGFDDSGNWCAALDVADDIEGNAGDTNALAKRKGVILRYLEEWGEHDTGETTRRAIASCQGLGRVDLQYDAVGVGAGVKAEANRLIRDRSMRRDLRFVPWHAGAKVLYPERNVVPHDKKTPLNQDMFENLKAQGWWDIHIRFEKTFRAVTQGVKFDPSELISIDTESIPVILLRKLEKELSQPTWGQSSRLKMMVNKKPDGTRSPNLADSVMMCYFPANAPQVIVDAETLQKSRMPMVRRLGQIRVPMRRRAF